MFRPVAVLLILFLWPGAASAEVTPAQRAELAVVVGEFVTATRAKDTDRIIAATPQRVFAHIARTAGIPLEQLLPALSAQIKTVMSQVTFVEISMSMDDARYLQTPDGTDYVLIPTRMIMSMAGQPGRIKGEEFTLALIDEGEWRLMRVSETAQLQILRQVYPSFAGVVFPKGSMQILE